MCLARPVEDDDGEGPKGRISSRNSIRTTIRYNTFDSLHLINMFEGILELRMKSFEQLLKEQLSVEHHPIEDEFGNRDQNLTTAEKAFNSGVEPNMNNVGSCTFVVR